MLAKILSGGQTGVDRATLDVAVACGIPYGGWCPRGGWAEDAPTPPGILTRYPGLAETPDYNPLQRTAWNVRDSDAVLVLVDEAGTVVSPGTLWAVDFARDFGKPYLVLDVSDAASIDRARQWLTHCETVNIAGPRESEAPGIYLKSWTFLSSLLSRAATSG